MAANGAHGGTSAGEDPVSPVTGLGEETWFSYPVRASGVELQSIADSSLGCHSPSCHCHMASGDTSVPVWLGLLCWLHAQAAHPGHLYWGALALGGQSPRCPPSPSWPGERSGTCRGTRAIAPEPSSPSETWGGPAMGLCRSLPPAHRLARSPHQHRWQRLGTAA